MAQWEDAPSASVTVSPAGDNWEDAPEPSMLQKAGKAIGDVSEKVLKQGGIVDIKSLLTRPQALTTDLTKKLDEASGGKMYEPVAPIQKPMGQRASELGVSTGVGAAIGYGLPKVLQKAPNAYIKALGYSMEAVPAIPRAMGGAAGSALQYLTGAYGEETGQPPAVTLPLQALSGLTGDIVGQKLSQSVLALGKSTFAALQGRGATALAQLGGTLGQTPEQRTAQAMFRQKQAFGQPTEMVEGEVGKKFQSQTQEELKQKFGYGKPTEVLAPETGRELMVPGTDMSVPGVGIKPSTLKPTGETITKELPKDPITGKEVPVSTALRDEFYSNVNKTTVKMRPEDRFSSSPEYKKFLSDLQPILAKGRDAGGISNTDLRGLKQALETDMGSIASRRQYAQTVDDLIRKWQPKIGATGEAAVDAATAKNIRTDLREAFSQWAEKNNLGTPEKAYREAFRAEKTAEAKDKIPYIISQYGKTGEAKKMALQISKDPYLKPVLDKAIQQRLANTDVGEIKTEFKRMDKLLEASGLATPKELDKYRKIVKQIDKLQKEGGNSEPLERRLKTQLLRTFALYTGGKVTVESYKGQ